MARYMTSWSKLLTHQMKDRSFTGSDAINVLPFLRDFKTECHVNRIHEGAEIWLMTSFLSGAAK